MRGREHYADTGYTTRNHFIGCFQYQHCHCEKSFSYDTIAKMPLHYYEHTGHTYKAALEQASVAKAAKGNVARQLQVTAIHTKPSLSGLGGTETGLFKHQDRADLDSTSHKSSP